MEERTEQQTAICGKMPLGAGSPKKEGIQAAEMWEGGERENFLI